MLITKKRGNAFKSEKVFFNTIMIPNRTIVDTAFFSNVGTILLIFISATLFFKASRSKTAANNVESVVPKAIPPSCQKRENSMLKKAFASIANEAALRGVFVSFMA